MKKIIILFLLIISPLGFGQERFAIYLDFTKVEKMSKAKKKLMHKSSLEAIFSTRRFELNLQKPKSFKNTEIEWYSVNAKVFKSNDLYSIELALVNLFDKKIYNFVSKKGVSTEKLQLVYRKLIYKLLYGENFDEEKSKILDDKIISLPSKSDRKSLPEEGEENINGLGFEAETGDDSKDGRDLKEKKKNKKKKKNELKLQDFDAVDLNLETIPRKVRGADVDSLKWLNKYTFSSGYTVEDISAELFLPGASNDLESFKTVALNQKIDLGAVYNVKHKTKGNFNQLQLNLSKIISEDKFSTPFYIKVHNSFFFYIPDLSIFFAPKIGFERDYFVNFSERGSGEQLYESSSLWYGLSFLYRLSLFKRTLKLSSSVNLSFFNDISSNDAVKSLEANNMKYDISAEFQLFKGLYLGFQYVSYEVSDTADQILDISRQETLVSLIYQ